MHGRRLSPVLIAAACAAGLVCLWLLALHTGAGRHVDARVYGAFTRSGGHAAHELAYKIIQLGDPSGFALLALAVLGVAAVRRRLDLLVSAAVVLACAPATTQILKQLTAVDRHPLLVAQASWPSGHTTGATAVALCLVLVAPAGWRRAAEAAAGMYSVGMAYSLLVLGSHALSDVVGAMLVAGLWASLVVAVSRWRRSVALRAPAAEGPSSAAAAPPSPVAAAGPSPAARPSPAPAAGVGVAAMTAALLLAAFTQDPRALTAGWLAVAAVAAVVVTGVAAMGDGGLPPRLTVSPAPGGRPRLWRLRSGGPPPTPPASRPPPR